MEDAHTYEAGAVIARLGSDEKRGLKSSQIPELQQRYGRNEVDPPERMRFVPFLALFS